MAKYPASLSVGYVVKMFPRLSETFILNEILELERRGVQVVIFSIKRPNEGRFHPQLSALKAKVLYLDELDPKKWANWLGAEWSVLSSHCQGLWELLGEALARGDGGRVDYIWWAAWIASQAHKLGLSHLHAHFATLPSTIACLAHRITGIPFSFTAHAKDIFVYDTDEHYLREKLTAARFVVTVTHFNRRYLQEKVPAVGDDKIKVIYNGINLDYFKPVESESREPNLILAVGRLVAKKGFNVLLDACGLLKKNGIPFRCVIVGDGNEAPNLQKQWQMLQLEREVTFAGPKNLDEVLSLMRQATILCLPCTVGPDNNVDALPTVLLEALACGLPIISTAVSGIPEIVDSGVDGILVEPNDPHALSKEIAQLLSSPKLRVQFAKNGRKKAVERFDLHKNVGSLLSAYLDRAITEESQDSSLGETMHVGVPYGKK